MNENITNISSQEFMRTVDLHFHTNHSDGKNTPEEMLRAYKEKALKKLLSQITMSSRHIKI